MSRSLLHYALMAVLFGVLPAAAQTPAAPGAPPSPAPPAAPVVVVDQDARQTMQQLHQLLRQYPPSVREIFRLDHSLLNRPDYMVSYPMLNAFLTQHPEIARNPAFYFGEPFINVSEPAGAVGVAREIRNTFEGLFFAAVFISAFLVIAWVIKQVIDHRRWQRLTAAQRDVHNKLIDRLTTNDELLAYLESPTGRRFFDGVPLPADARLPQRVDAPVNRILWSVQVGIVLAVVGAALWMLFPRSGDDDVTKAFLLLGAMILALGSGIVVSALVSWALSIRLGLMERPQS